MVKKRVLNDPVIYPEKFSEKARSICEGLLVKEPEQRLGFRNGSCDELRDHPFFTEINWIKLNAGPFELFFYSLCHLSRRPSVFCVLCSAFVCKSNCSAANTHFAEVAQCSISIYFNGVPLSVINIKKKNA